MKTVVNRIKNAAPIFKFGPRMILAAARAKMGLTSDLNPGHVIPPIPQRLLPLSAAAVSGAWNSLGLSPSTGITGQVVQRSSDGVTWNNLATISPMAKSYSDPDPLTGMNFYRVQLEGPGTLTHTVSVQTPAAPTRATASYTAGVVTLHWQDGNSPSTGFSVDRSLNFFDWTPIGSVAGNVLTLTDTPPAGNLVFYRVRATTAGGTSKVSDVVMTGPGVYGWLRAADLNLADGASLGTTWVDPYGKMTLTNPGGSTWTYKSAGMGGNPEVVCDNVGWHYNTTLAQPFTILMTSHNLGLGVSDPNNFIWLHPDNGATGIRLFNTGNPNPDGSLVIFTESNGQDQDLPPYKTENIWLLAINGAGSTVHQNGVGTQLVGALGTDALGAGTLRAQIGFSDFLVLNYQVLDGSADYQALNGYFSQRLGVAVGDGAVSDGSIMPAFDRAIVPIVQTQLATPYALGPVGQTWYASPTGSSTNDGKSAATAWDLATAFSQASILPTDQLLLVGGVYKYPPSPGSQGFPLTLKGAAGQYIKIMPMPGHHVQIDGGIYVPSSNPAQYCMVKGLEVLVSETKLVDGQPIGFDTLPTPWPAGGFSDSFGTNNIWCNNVAHDNNQCDLFSSVGPHLADNVYWGNGYLTTGRPEGHSIYGHNAAGFPEKVISGCVFGQSLSYGIHCYTEEEGDPIQNVTVDGIVSFNNGLQPGGDCTNLVEPVNGPIINLQLHNTINYDCHTLIGDTIEPSTSAALLGNVLAGTSSIEIHTPSWTGSFVETDAVNNSSLRAAAWLRPHMYDSNKATLSLFSNGSLLPMVDLGGFLNVGDTYAIYDVQNLWGAPLVTGTFDGAPVTVDLTNALGGTAFQVCMIFRTAPAAPSVPENVVVSPGSLSLALSWTTPDDAVMSYNVLRSTSPTGPFTQIASGITTKSYTDTGLIATDTYYYQVEAVNTYGTSASSVVAAGTVPGSPGQVTGLAAVTTIGRVSLTWDVQTGPAAATSYNIQRATVSGGPYTTVGTASGGAYVDTGLTNGTTYYYVVSGSNAAGTGPVSAQVSGSPVFGGTKSVAGLIAYYDAGTDSRNAAGTLPADGAAVKTLVDEITPADNDLTQATVANQPLYRAAGMTGGKPCLDYSSSAAMDLGCTTLTPSGFAAITMDAVIEMAAYPTGGPSVLRIGQASSTLELDIMASGKLEAALQPAGSFSFSTLVSTALIPLNTRVHVGVTHDGTTMTLYIGGAAVASGAMPALAWKDAVLLMFPHCLINLPAVWNRALNSDEMAAIAGT